MQTNTQAEDLRAPHRGLSSHGLVAVTGGKGGVGKSTVAVNLAVALGRGVRDGVAPRVLLVDCDLGLASLDALLTLPRTGDLGDALASSTPVSRLVVRGPGGIEVLAAPRGIERFADLSLVERREAVRLVCEAAHDRDTTILDLPAGIHPDGLAFAESAPFVLVVTTPDPAALADAYAVVKITRDRHPAATVGLLVNQVSGPSEGRQVQERLRAVAARFLGVAVEPFGWIPRDAAVTRATAARRPVVVAEPASAAAAAFRALAGRVSETLDTLCAARSSTLLA